MNDIDQVIADRAKTHGSFEQTGACAQLVKDTMRKFGWEKLALDQREALDMIAQKVARILTGDPFEPDHWKDIGGYARMIEARLATDGHEMKTASFLAKRFAPRERTE